MPFVLNMPKLSPTMERGTLAKWHKKVGDFVEAGELLLEVATDKATVEYTALDAGFLRRILVEAGHAADVGQEVAIFSEKKEESIDSILKEIEAKKKAVKEEVKPKEEVVNTTSTHVREVSRIEPLFKPEAPLDIPFKGMKEEQEAKSSPLARKLAKEKGLHIANMTGSGPGGRVVARDLQEAPPASKVNFGPKGEPEFKAGEYEEEALSPMRQVIAKRLQESKSFIPHFYVAQEVDASPMMKIKDELGFFGTKVSINDLLVRAVALSLRDHPGINSGFNSETHSTIYFKTVDISIAVSVDGGLITPIVRYADYKNVGQISAEIKSLAKKAKEGRLERHEYAGGSFTISNLGMYGVSSFQAIINPPQSAILAVSGIEEKPVVVNGQIQVGKRMLLTISCDHRVIDGVAAAEFMKTLQKYVEKPSVLLL